MFQLLRFWSLVAAAAMVAGCAAPPASTSRSAAPTGPSRVVQSDDGLSEITVPPVWQTRPNLSRNADLRLSNALDDHYLLVNSYRPGDLKPMSFEEMAKRLNNALLENLEAGKMSAAKPMTIDGRPAIAHELYGKLGTLELVYLSVMVDGRHARYHLVGWAPADGDISGLRQVIAAFRESAKQRKAQQRVNLDFNWPSRLKANASFKQKAVKRRGGFAVQGEAVMSVRPAGKDELVVSTQVTRQKMDTAHPDMKDGKAMDAYLQSVLQAAATDVPDYVVNRDGEFVRVENLSGYHQRVMDSMLKGLPKNNPEAQARAQQMLKAMLTEQTLTVAMQDEWNNMVELWAGGSYVPGQRYDFTLAYQAAALGGQSFPMATTQQLTGRVPCHPNAAKSSCVRLLQQTRVDGPEYTAAMDAYVRKTVGHGVRVDKMEVVSTLEVIADPRTMVPYFTHKKEVKRVTVSAEGKTTTNEDLKDEEVTYRY